MVTDTSRADDRGAPPVRARLVGIYALLAAMNFGAWAWALLAFHDMPTLLGMALVVYGLGLRHAVDADHIAAIDNVTRRLMQMGQRPISIGLFFALGHSAIIVVVAGLVAVAATMLDRFQMLQDVGGTVSATASSLFLLAIAVLNIFIFASVYRGYRRMRAGGRYVEEDIDVLLNSRGFLVRLLRPLLRLVTRGWHMLFLGMLFGLGFDTATEIAMFGLSAAHAAEGVPIMSILAFPALFAAGMSLVDTTDGVLMLGVYEWAFVNPLRKLYYNMTITLVSIIVGVFVGGIEALGLIGEHLRLSGGLWNAVGVLNDNFDRLGFAIIALFVLAWGVSFLIYKYRTFARLAPRTGELTS